MTNELTRYALQIEINEFATKFYQEQLSKSEKAQEYLKQRDINQKSIKEFKIGFSGEFDELYQALKAKGLGEEEILESGLVEKADNGTYIDRYRNRIMFPTCDAKGNVIAFGGRVLDDTTPKYITTSDNAIYTKAQNLYGMNIAKDYCQEKSLIIVEGYFDVITLHQHGIKNVVALMGTAITEEQVRLIKRYTNKVLIILDADGAGQVATKRAIKLLEGFDIEYKCLRIDNAKDPDEFIRKFGSNEFKNLDSIVFE